MKLLWNRSLDGAPLRGALLDGAPLRGALLDGAPLRGALLDGAPLRGALLRAVLLGVTFLTASLCGAGTRAAGASAICNSADLMDVVNRPNTAWSPCVVGPDGVLIESGYYQNASSVGGSTVAEYPSAELRFGFAHDIEAVLDTPSQIAASGNQGRGTFSESSPGVGFKWQLANGPNSAYGLGAEIRPPATAASFPWQPKFALNLESSEAVNAHLRTLLALGLVEENHLDRYAPSTPGLRTSVGMGVPTSPTSVFSAEVNDQASVARSLRGQSFGNLSWRQRLSRGFQFDMEAGQTFNTSAHTRPHYIGAGLAFGSSP